MKLKFQQSTDTIMDTKGAIMANVIENAALDIKEKEEKLMLKKFQQKKVRHLERQRSQDLLNTQLNEGKISSLLVRRHATEDITEDACASGMYMRLERRTAVAERNETERELVKVTLKYLRKGLSVSTDHIGSVGSEGVSVAKRGVLRRTGSSYY